MILGVPIIALFLLSWSYRPAIHSALAIHFQRRHSFYVIDVLRRFLGYFAFGYVLAFSFNAFGICVSENHTKLRAEPNSSAKITWVVGRYMPFVELERRGGWIKVRDLEGEVHWASASDLSTRDRCVVVRVLSAALRTGPSSDTPVADVPTVERYTAFKRLEADPEDWYWVEDEAEGRYWIKANHVWRPTTVSHIGF
jgi:SH3-like domain-containing protein